MKLHFTIRRRPKPASRRKRRLMIPLHLVYFAAILLLMLAITGAIFGIYGIIDRTLTASEDVMRLQKEVTDETFKSDDYVKAVEVLDVKTRQPEPPDWSRVINPFLADRQNGGATPPPNEGLSIP